MPKFKQKNLLLIQGKAPTAEKQKFPCHLHCNNQELYNYLFMIKIYIEIWAFSATDGAYLN